MHVARQNDVRPWVLGVLLVTGCSRPGSDRTSAVAGDPPPDPRATREVLEHHGGASRDGVFVDPHLTLQAAPRLALDPGFVAVLHGPTYAQPLYVERPGGGQVLAATEQDEVVAFDASTGQPLWRRALATPVPRSRMPCGNIDPYGITGTPIVDAATRTVYLDAVVATEHGRGVAHELYALDVGDGAVRPGWPVDVGAALATLGVRFHAEAQSQRGALALLEGALYVPFGGLYGDCGDYRGMVVGVPLGSPRSVRAWVAPVRGGGVWAPGGIASDGSFLYVATGNTFGASQWSGGEAVLRLAPGPQLSNAKRDYFAPADWKELDAADADLGGSGPVLVTVPGAAPSHLIVALGKDGNAYLLDRDDLGGIGGAIAKLHAASSEIINAAAAYTTKRATYVVFKGAGIGCPAGAGTLVALRIDATSPPRLSLAWCADAHGAGSPSVSTTDGTSDAIVWAVGAEGDERLHGFDGDTGAVVFAGGPPLGEVRRFQAPIVVNGSLFVAADDRLYRFK